MTPEIPRLPRISIRETNRRGLPPQRGQYDPSTPPSSCTTWGRQDPSGYLISMITSRLIPQPGEQPISCHALTLDRHCDLTYRFPPRENSLTKTSAVLCCLPETIAVELIRSRISLATRTGWITYDPLRIPVTLADRAVGVRVEDILTASALPHLFSSYCFLISLHTTRAGISSPGQSGWKDSNLRLPGPKPGALTKLSYIP